MKNEFSKSECVAITGHRIISFGKQKEMRDRIDGIIVSLYQQGKRVFYCGMAIGFDMLVAERVVKLRNQYADLCLMAVVPFLGQSDNWCIIHQEKYEQLLAQSTKVIVLSEHYFKGCLLRRNDYMIDHCSTLLAYYDGGLFEALNPTERVMRHYPVFKRLIDTGTEFIEITDFAVL